MKEEKITVKEKTYLVRELKYSDVMKLTGLPKEESAKQLILVSTELTEEDYAELSAFEGLAITKAINKINGFDENENFQEPIQKD